MVVFFPSLMMASYACIDTSLDFKLSYREQLPKADLVLWINSTPFIYFIPNRKKHHKMVCPLWVWGVMWEIRLLKLPLLELKIYTDLNCRISNPSWKKWINVQIFMDLTEKIGSHKSMGFHITFQRSDLPFSFIFIQRFGQN